MTVRLLIREKREEIGFSQGGLASKIGMPQSTLCNAEHGRDPRVSTVAAIARGLGCTIEELVRVRSPD